MSNPSSKNEPSEPRQQALFSLPVAPPARPPEESASGRREPRMQKPERRQIAYRAFALDDMLPEDHQARIVWDYVQALDLSRLEKAIKAVEGRSGRPPICPQILLALWLYATLRAIGSARELSRRCDPQSGEMAFLWICGEVTVNYHTLATFRTQHVQLLNDLLTEGVAVLQHEGLVKMERVAQDGMKVRASAGASSFRRRKTLEQHLTEAKQQVDILQQELENDPASASRRQKAARERAARERAERLARAHAQLAEIEAKKSARDKDKARVSTTDPDARVMKTADSGFRPAYNVQLATDTATQIITGVDVTNSGSDQGKMAPMIEQHTERYGKSPGAMLVDGGFVKKSDIDAVSAPRGNTKVYAPVMASKSEMRDPHTPRGDDSPAVAAWRKRMGTEEAKEIYKERAATAECVNAIARNRGLCQVRVRGLDKVLAVALWYALAHNLMRAAVLRAEAAKHTS